MRYILQVKNLTVEVDKKVIINDLSFNISSGEIVVLLGPNASGKSTLAAAIMGLSNYKIKRGEILFKGRNITHLSSPKRAKLGIALAFQNPPPIKGVNLETLLKNISLKKKEEKLPAKWESRILKRELNVGLSGGEKKISEMMQLARLDPQLMILDEIDSGLDIQKLKELTAFIRKTFLTQKISLLIITHRGDILRYLPPQRVLVMLKGKIICSSSAWKKVWQTIKKYGYEKCKKSPFSLS